MNRLRTAAAILTLTALQAFPAEGRGQGIVLREIAADEMEKQRSCVRRGLRLQDGRGGACVEG